VFPEGQDKRTGRKLSDRQMVAAIYNVFDGLELLPYSVSNIAPMVEGVIFVYQDESNYGEKANVGEEVYKIANTLTCQVALVLYKPDLRISPSDNERKKREIGLHTAKRIGFTHFLDVDCDEFYKPDDFKRLKKHILTNNLNGAVVRSRVYFAKPTLTIGEDITLVPFIHKVDCKHEFNRHYPFAFDKTIRIDPTRQLSFTDRIELHDVYMHHYSWVRKDYTSKINNSSARMNIQRSNIVNDLVHAKSGGYCEFYKTHLTDCPNVFGLPEWQKEEKQNTPVSKISFGDSQ
jgi:hypothetical protein